MPEIGMFIFGFVLAALMIGGFVVTVVGVRRISDGPDHREIVDGE